MEKNYVIFVNESCILLISWIFLDFDFKFIKRFGLKLDLDYCYALKMITVVIETFARCQLYRLLWP